MAKAEVKRSRKRLPFEIQPRHGLAVRPSIFLKIRAIWFRQRRVGVLGGGQDSSVREAKMARAAW